MPRANRFFLSGNVWRITHRCHKKEFLLKFGRDRDRWRYWLYESRKRYGLCVLDYIITSNHIHLLVLDRGKGEIAASMQLIAGRVAQEYNRRKQRCGAFWEDRYHATAVEKGAHLARCIAYIDLNMVRAGAVRQPGEWRWSGYNEIQHPPKRYRVIDMERLCDLFGVGHEEALRQRHREWTEALLLVGEQAHEPCWTSGIAVGSQAYIKEVKATLGDKVKYRECVDAGGRFMLREQALAYSADFGGEKGGLS